MIDRFIATVPRDEERSRTVIAVVAGLVGAVAAFVAWWLWR